MTDKDERLKKRRKKKIFNVLYLFLIVCFIVVFSWTGYAASYVYPLLLGGLEGNTTVDPVKEEVWDEGQFTILLMGSDRREGQTNSRSDTLMIAFADTNTKTVRLLSIPRDTYVTIPTSGERTKVNHAYAYGGVDLSKATLESNFGITVDYYVDIDFQGFADVIDAIGGVTIDVPKKMYYPAEGIDLEAGLQKLDGTQSLEFVRFRSDALGDLGRIERQQDFMKALQEQMMQMGNVLKIPDLSQAIMDNVVTDLTGTQIIKLLATFKDGVTLETYQVPGEAHYQDGISYFFASETEGPAFFEALTSYQAPATDDDEDTATTEDTTTTEETEAE